MPKAGQQYQLFPSLRKEEYDALSKDIEKRGVMVPVEVDEDGNILDGHHRVEIAERLGLKYKTIVRKFKTEGEKREHVIKLNLCRRHLSDWQWGEAFERLLEEKGAKLGRGQNQGLSANVAESCEELGVARRTAERRLAAARKKRSLPKAVQRKVESGEVELKDAIKEQAAAKKAEEREAAAVEAKARTPDSDYGVRHGDIRKWQELGIEAESVDLIFTDPPYHRETVDLYGHLAAFAKHALKPGGSLVSFCGQIILPTVLDLFSGQLRYWWVACCYHTGDTLLRMNEYGIVNVWKPMVWFVHGTRGDKNTFVDDVVVSKPEKSHHKWQQGTIEAEYFIDKLTQPDGLIVDPFCGGGTTAVAAARLGRTCLTFDVDETAVLIARDRVRESMQERAA